MKFRLSVVFKAVTLIRSEQKYSDLETCAEPWNPPFNDRVNVSEAKVSKFASRKALSRVSVTWNKEIQSF